MLEQANFYAMDIPLLEWIYCGEWPMEIRFLNSIHDGVKYQQSVPQTM